MNRKISRHFLTGLACLSLSALSHADNPIIKDRFSADPAAIVHDDKVYLYTGHDEATPEGDFFVLKEWQIHSSTDLEDWTLEGEVPRTIFDWARHDSAWAAQTIERDGKFYWYVTVLNDDPDPTKNGYAIGVAVSDDPVHGWKDALGKPLVRSDQTQPAPHMEGKWSWDDIDPSVFVDDDGQAFLYWGNSHLYYAKLKDNMMELDGEIHEVDINGMAGTFTEAPWLHKYNGNYYLTFAMNYPEELAYAMSDSPTGPWTYKGKLMDVLEDSGTSHQAVLEYEDNWYFIYHTAALPTGGNFRRSVSVEKLVYNADGTIDKIVPTASGVTHDSVALQSHQNPEHYLRHEKNDVQLSPLTSADAYAFKWHIVPGLSGDGSNTVSIQSENKPGYYIHSGNEAGNERDVALIEHDGTAAFAQAATFERVAGLADGDAVSYRVPNTDDYLAVDSAGHLVLKSVKGPAARKAATFTRHVAE